MAHRGLAQAGKGQVCSQSGSDSKAASGDDAVVLLLALGSAERAKEVILPSMDTLAWPDG